LVARPEAGEPTSPVKRKISRRAILERVIPANDLSSKPPVPALPDQSRPTVWGDLVSELRWLAESELRWLTDPKAWGTVIFVVLGIIAFVRLEDQANPGARPAAVRATRVPATQTPLPRLTATRTVVNNPTVASFGSNFDISDGLIPSTGERFSASIRDKALRMEVFGKGAHGKAMFNAAPAVADFNLTVHVGSTTGQGEMLIYVRKPDSGRTWVFAVDPGASTWGLYEESPWRNRLTTVIAHQDYSSASTKEPLRTVTVTRKGSRTSLLINGTAVAPRVAGSMPRIGGPVTVGIGAMIPEEPESYNGQSFVVTVDRVAMLADDG
jgi:hypothetical protein